MTHSILARADASMVRLDPYPHLVIEDALPDDLYRELARTFPDGRWFSGGGEPENRKYQTGARESLLDDRLAPAWREFVAYHASAAFWAEVLRVWGPTIRDVYPELERRPGRALEAFSVGVRSKEDRDGANRGTDVVLDCQIGVDFTFSERVARGPHVDNPHELYAALLYLRDPEDASEGGALTVLRERPGAGVVTDDRTVKADVRPAEIDEAKVEVVRAIPYRANTVAMFLNTPRSIHGVTPRSASRLPRRQVNVIGEFYGPDSTLFRLVRPPRPDAAPPPPPGLLSRLKRRLLG